jgi:hypothetical protein
MAKSNTKPTVSISKEIKLGRKSYTVNDALDHAFTLHEAIRDGVDLINEMQKSNLAKAIEIGSILSQYRSSINANQLFKKTLDQHPSFGSVSARDRSDYIHAYENQLVLKREAKKNPKVLNNGLSSLRKTVKKASNGTAKNTKGKVIKSKKTNKQNKSPVKLQQVVETLVTIASVKGMTQAALVKLVKAEFAKVK